MTIIILVQGFCSVRIKITQYPDGFRLNLLLLLYLIFTSI